MALAMFAIFRPPASEAFEETLIRSGDVLAVTLPGEDVFDEPYQVETDGTILLPEVGRIDLSGMTIQEAREHLSAALGTIYRDLSSFDVSLVERRLILKVLGYVEKPGTVDLPSDANLQSAIVAAGGLIQGAQLDRIQLRRNDETTTVDYKAYLDSGEISILPLLEPGDVVFVPASPLIGNVQVNFDAQTLTAAGDAGEDETAIRVFGEVQKPGTFSYRNGQSVVDLIMKAGGITRYAGVEKIRVMNGGEPLTFDLKAYLDSGRLDMVPELRPGSTIYVPISVEEVKAGGRTVYVMGEVAAPGAYEMTEGATFFDVLANSGGPNRYADARQVRIIRGDGSVRPFDLIAYTEGDRTSGVPEVRPGDAIFVPEKVDQLEPSWLKVPPERAVRVMGAVVSPGRYEWSDEMSLLDLLAHAGGPTRDADTSQLNIIAAQDGEAHPERFDLEAFLSNGGGFDQLPVIRAGYTIMVPELPKDPTDNKSQWVRQSGDRSIYVMGAVGSPGRYAFNDSLNFLDILAAADGPTVGADIQNIRVSHRNADGARVSKLDLALYFETGDEAILPWVMPGDVVYVPERDREWTEIDSANTVRVLGAVGAPGRYNFTDNMTILDLLAESGGPTPDSWQSQIVVVNLATGKPEASSFDLVEFAKTGDFTKLPVVRPGDTIYVPTISQSNWSIFMSGVRGIVQIVALVVLVAG
jgi:protein involved in polysaccharide export with SLBB domain